FGGGGGVGRGRGALGPGRPRGGPTGVGPPRGFLTVSWEGAWEHDVAISPPRAPMRPSPTPTAVGRAGARVGEPGGHRASRARAGRPSRGPDGHRGSWKRAGEPGAGRRAGAGEPGPAGGGGVAWLARDVEETCSGVTWPTGKFTRG